MSNGHRVLSGDLFYSIKIKYILIRINEYSGVSISKIEKIASFDYKYRQQRKVCVDKN